jgi:uncharacterized protein
MAFRLTPHERGFYPLFTRAAENIARAADDLAALVAAPPADRAELATRVKDAEHAGDELTHEIMTKLDKTFVTPFDREDIYRLASALDDVMDFMEEAVDLVNLYEIQELPDRLANQVDVIRRSADLTAEAMPKLRTMHDLEEYWIEINRLENEGDKSYRRILAKLFNGQYDALTVMKLKDVVDALEGAIDAFETVANIVEQIAVKES